MHRPRNQWRSVIQLANRPALLPLFSDQASVTGIRLEKTEWRFHRLELWPSLFGHTLLARQRDRIGTQYHFRLAT